MIVLISEEEARADEMSYAAWLLEDGLDRFHFRRPNLAPFARLKQIMRFPVECLDRISVHSELSWGVEHEAAMPRLPVSKHKTEKESWEWLSDSKVKSASFHRVQDLMNCPIELDYAFLSPVFPSISKPGYSASEDLQSELPLLKDLQKPFPVLALGGVHLDNLEEIHELGFDGFALKGAFWQSEDPAALFQAMRDKWYELKGSLCPNLI